MFDVSIVFLYVDSDFPPPPLIIFPSYLLFTSYIGRQPGRKRQPGQYQLRRQQWSTSTTFFMTNCMVKNVAK